MGRTRKNPLRLPTRVYAKHGAFYYIHRNGQWERLGTDLAEAKRKGNQYNDPANSYGTMAYHLDEFVKACEKRVKRGDLAPRTHEDYNRNLEPLKLVFGKMLPSCVEPKHVAQYLDLGAENGRSVRANREKSCLSACFTWMIRIGEGGVKQNPCIGIRRNRENPKDRYVEHHEYQLIREVAVRQVRGLLDLIYRTLQRPQDILSWTAANIVHKHEPDGKITRVIRSQQNKTGAKVDILITPEIDSILQDLRMAHVVTGSSMTLIHRVDGRRYTYSGLSAMLRRYVKKSGIGGFSFYDLKAKAATDMWLSGVPLEQIQVLCGHESIRTTEVYVKSHWRGTVQPNSVVIVDMKKAKTEILDTV